MKKVLAALLLVSTVLLVGCGEEPIVGNKVEKSEIANLPEGSKQKMGIADATATPAPPGVKTGTPGG